jgi:hypothetical protein
VGEYIMSEKKYQIFISSTYTDLIDARDKVISSILSMYHFPIGMEMFSADDDEQWEVIKETIDQSDYYVLILGQRYGSLATDGRSFTEKEYDYAKSIGVPVLSFIRDPEVPTIPSEREQEQEKIKQLERFILKAKGNKMCDFWKNTDELAHKVSLALPKAFKRHPRIGWARADKIASPEIMEEMATLSKENRTQRDELEKLRTSALDRSPEIKVLLNKNSELVLKYTELSGYNKLSYSKKLKYEEVDSHLLPYIEKEDIEEYNEKLPTDQEIDEYNEKKELGERIAQNGKELSIDVKNSGNAKANNIFAKIKFPQEIKILEKEIVEELLELKKLRFPRNPITQAQRKYDREHGQQKSLADFMGLGSSIDFLSTLHDYESSIGSLGSFRPIAKLNRTAWTRLDENTITIEIDDLLHTLRRTFEEDYFMLPLCKGTYEIKINIICEQYSKEQEYSIPVVIE